MDFWRLASPRFSTTDAQAFSGEGARLYPGRWNSQGVAVSYCADSVALAALEVLAGLEWLVTRFGPQTLCRARCDDALVEVLPDAQLPNDWASWPHPLTTRAIGDSWVTAQRSPVLLVPSAVVPFGRIAVLNPAHPRFGELTLERLGPFVFGGRPLPSP